MTLLWHFVPSDDTVTFSVSAAAWSWPGYGGIRVWKSAQRGPDGPVIDNVSMWPGPFLSTNFPASAFPMTLYVEGVSPSYTNADVVFYLSTATSCTDSAKVTVVNIDMGVDTDRSGNVDNSDDLGEDEWTMERGAFVPPLSTCDYAAYCGTNSTSARAQIVVRAPTGEGILPDYGLRLHKMDAATIADLQIVDDQGEAIVFTEYYDLPGWPTSNVTFYAASNRTRKMSASQPDLFTLGLEMVDADGGVVASDTVVLKVAPVILPPEYSSAQAVYSTFDLGIPYVTKLNCEEPATWQWTQDMVKFTKTQWTAGTVGDLPVTLGHPGQGNLSDVLRDQEHLPNLQWSVYGQGGNMMATPPLPNDNAPYGRLLLGNKDLSSQSYWSEQNIQPVFTLDTSWLAVGHVDEVIMFIAANKVLFADPWKAADLLHGEIAAGNGAHTIWFGGYLVPSSSRTKTIQDVVVATDGYGAFKTNSLLIHLPNATTNETLVFNNNLFEVCDVLRVDSELLEVQSVNGSTVTVSRAAGGRPAAEHPANSAIYAYSDVLKRNLPVGVLGASPAEKMVTVTNALYQALGSYAGSVTFVPTPVLFDLATTTPPQYLANSANVVNCLVRTGGTGYYQNTGCTVFENYIFSVAPGAQPVDAWDILHQNEGEIHCGTAARRTLSASPPWWQQTTNWE